MKTQTLEDILLARGLVSEADLFKLLESERTRGQPLGPLLVQQGLITEEAYRAKIEEILSVL